MSSIAIKVMNAFMRDDGTWLGVDELRVGADLTEQDTKDGLQELICRSLVVGDKDGAAWRIVNYNIDQKSGS